MRIFAIGDPHLSFAAPKPMHIFGEHWRDHDKKIAENWNRIANDDDVLIIAGDISWAMKLEEAAADLEWIARLKGRKVLIKGNHDLWWSSRSKVRKIADPSIEILQADSIVINGVAIAGTRGWQCPGNEGSADMLIEGAEARYTEQDFKIYQREVGRLKLALESLRGKAYRHLIVVLHYPPMNSQHEESGFTRLIDEYGADWCVHGHLHGDSIKTAFNGVRGKTHYRLVSADSVDFAPFPVMEI